MYEFTNIENLEEFLIESLGTEMIVLPYKAEETVFFHNGDKMTINTLTGSMIWEPIKPGCMSSSRLSMRFHQWFGKGIIKYKTTVK